MFVDGYLMIFIRFSCLVLHKLSVLQASSSAREIKAEPTDVANSGTREIKDEPTDVAVKTEKEFFHDENSSVSPDVSYT